MRIRKNTLVALFIICGVATHADAVSFDVMVDTAPINGLPGFLAFDFIDGDGLVNNQTTISDFATDGALGAFSSVGGVGGNLSPGPLLLSDSDFFNEALQEINFGSSVSFRLAFTTDGPFAPFPDSFSFFLLDQTFVPFPSSDPFGADALFTVDIASNTPGPVLFSSDFATASVAPVDNGGTPIPEPATATMLALGLVLIAGRATLFSRRYDAGKYRTGGGAGQTLDSSSSLGKPSHICAPLNPSHLLDILNARADVYVTDPEILERVQERTG